MRRLLLLPTLAVVAALPRDSDTVYTTHKDKCMPEQIHIAFGEKINDITVTWVTFQTTRDTILQYGEKTLDKRVKGELKQFVDGGTAKSIRWIHNVRLKDLKFDTSYVYKVGSECGWSEQFSFKTPRSGEDWPVNIVLIGDLGIQKDWTRSFVEADMKTGHYDFLIHVGDIAYDMDSYNGENGDIFMNNVQPFAAIRPYMTCPGNHEYNYNYSNYKNRFSMPGNSESMFYSYDIGPIHFISINTEAYYNNVVYPSPHAHDNKEILTHYHWLENDLKEANKPENRQKRPWIIAYGHRPFYCSNRQEDCGASNYFHRIGIPEFGGYALEPLLYKYTVDLEIFGHEHSYERMWPVYNKTVYNGSYEQPYLNPGAPVQVTSGSAGCHEDREHFETPSPWTAFQSRHYSYTRLRVQNKTHLYMEQIATHEPDPINLSQQYKLLEGAPQKIDEFWLVKHHRHAYNIN